MVTIIAGTQKDSMMRLMESLESLYSQLEARMFGELPAKSIDYFLQNILSCQGTVISNNLADISFM